MTYEWSSSLETGHSEIDKQHQKLIGAINNLLEASQHGKGRAELDKLVRFLNDYTVLHFNDEEKLQLRYKYPDYLNHKRLHESFKADLRNISKQLREQGPTVALLAQVNAKLGDWLIAHIKHQDTKVAEHIRTHPMT